VYETHATNEGPWLDNQAAFTAMFDAALQGFPNPSPGVRQVNIHLGGRQQQAAASAPAATSPASVSPAPAPTR